MGRVAKPNWPGANDTPAGCRHRRGMLGIDALKYKDWPAVREIHAEGIATGQARSTSARRPGRSGTAAICRNAGSLRVVDASWIEGRRLGHGCSAVSSRPAYRGVAEVSLHRRCGALPSGAGRALCEPLGFRVVGVRERIGKIGTLARRRDGRAPQSL